MVKQRLLWTVDRVEDPAIFKVLLVSFPPGAEHLADREQLELGKFLHHGGVDVLWLAGSVVVLRSNLLAGWRIEVLEIRFGNLCRAIRFCVLVDNGDRRFGDDADR